EVPVTKPALATRRCLREWYDEARRKGDLVRLTLGCVCTVALLGCRADGVVREAEPVASLASALSAPTKLHTFSGDGGTAAVSTPVPFGGWMYFTASETGSSQLWETDGTVAGTLQVTTNPARSNILDITPMDGKLYFSAYTAATGQELFTSD